ncbi:hypothetical protein MKY51_07500 [Solibacillus sp. FSL R5-0691]|uniref:hypothetical protein n=1 Tax=Solibacillus sp. FSL R5-0691 TaxID=2921653 RepID=UPI0030CE2CA6
MSKKTVVILLGGILFTIILVFTFLQKNNNVTAEWKGFYLEQTSKTSFTQYAIESIDGTLEIKNSFIPSPRIGGSTKEDFNKDITITETKLIPGEYKKYSVFKNKDTYTIKVKGNPKFSYNLNKVAPRKFIGEDGIEYSTSLYLE